MRAGLGFYTLHRWKKIPEFLGNKTIVLPIIKSVCVTPPPHSTPMLSYQVKYWCSGSLVADIDLFLIPTRATNWKDVRFCRIIVSKGIFVSMDQMDQVHIAQKHISETLESCSSGLKKYPKIDLFSKIRSKNSLSHDHSSKNIFKLVHKFLSWFSLKLFDGFPSFLGHKQHKKARQRSFFLDVHFWNIS